MPVTSRIDPDTGIAYYTAAGEIIRAEIIAAIDQVYADPAYRAPWRSLWDLTRATPRLEADDLRAIMVHVQEHRPEDSGKVAIVATQDLAYGMGRMYELLASDQELITTVFRAVEPAMEWLFEGET
jgi:hypothetical protein